MNRAYIAPVLSAALTQFKKIVSAHSEKGGGEGKPLIVFCEDRLSLVAERAVCEEVGGTFSVAVYTLSRFLTAETGKCENILSSQGSAMAVRRLIEKNRDSLQLFKRLSTAGAAQEVYDTIALLYSSKISPDDLSSVAAGDKLLARKLHDLELLYREYMQFLSESGSVDRNVYLRRLPDVIRFSEKLKGADVLFLGFQAFTATVADCVKASIDAADDVFGIFIGGRESKYVNEGLAAFLKICKDSGGEAQTSSLPSSLCAAAEQMRKHAFEADSFYSAKPLEITDEVCIAEATDEEQECEFIAAQILKQVMTDGMRYRQISVMLPDVNLYQPVLERTFGEYGIPMYVDRRYPLSSHPVCTFLLNFLSCALDGGVKESVCAAVSSPLFTVDGTDNLRRDKDMFVNYMLRIGGYKGAARREVNVDVCESEGIDALAVERVRARFLQGFDMVRGLDKKDGAAVCNAIRELIAVFRLEEGLKKMAESAAACGYPSAEEMSLRAYEIFTGVIGEAEKLTAGERLPLREFVKILKSGFTAAEVSLIPPKQDAVFVGDISACANAGSAVLFAAGLTDAVPAASFDTAILTDGELSSLEKLKVAISPKIAQVNARVREMTALNFTAFSRKLYLIYPVKSGGEECGKSEIIGYAERAYRVNGKPLSPVKIESIMRSDENFAYYCCRPSPAIRRLAFYLGGEKQHTEERAQGYMSAVYRALCESMGEDKLGEELAPAFGGNTPTGEDERAALYGRYISPTSLETYYSCPYKALMQQGLKLYERREGAFRPLDSGNFIHAVLETVAKSINDCESEEECKKLAADTAEKLMASPAYSSADAGADGYTSVALKEEAVAVSAGMYEQLKVSNFKVADVEKSCTLNAGGVLVGGRIDRVDTCGDMVRIIDYKTGTIDDSPSSYYMGLKLQLPLYLSAAARGRRAAGAYYFPANVDYTSEGGVSFTLRGFMDGSEDVVKSSDTTVSESEKSKYIGAYLNGRKVDKAMTREDFAYFLSYSDRLAREGAKGLIEGSYSPSPAAGACNRCAFAGCCGYDKERFGDRKEIKVNCADIAEVMRNEQQKTDGGDK